MMCKGKNMQFEWDDNKAKRNIISARRVTTYQEAESYAKGI
jgi:uncharacterized DUF497 family protein